MKNVPMAIAGRLVTEDSTSLDRPNVWERSFALRRNSAGAAIAMISQMERTSHFFQWAEQAVKPCFAIVDSRHEACGQGWTNGRQEEQYLEERMSKQSNAPLTGYHRQPSQP